VNFLSVLCLALAVCARSPCDNVARFCARSVLCWLAFPSAPALGSTDSAADRSALFTGFTATTAGSDFSRSCIIGYGSVTFPMRDLGGQRCPSVERETLPGSDVFLLVRDVFFDHGQSVSPSHRGTAHVAFDVAYRARPLAVLWLSRLNGTPTQSLCTLRTRRRRRPRNTRYRALATAYPDRVSHRTTPAFLAHKQSNLLEALWIASLRSQ